MNLHLIEFNRSNLGILDYIFLIGFLSISIGIIWQDYNLDMPTTIMLGISIGSILWFICNYIIFLSDLPTTNIGESQHTLESFPQENVIETSLKDELVEDSSIGNQRVGIDDDSRNN